MNITQAERWFLKEQIYVPAVAVGVFLICYVEFSLNSGTTLTLLHGIYLIMGFVLFVPGGFLLSLNIHPDVEKSEGFWRRVCLCFSAALALAYYLSF